MEIREGHNKFYINDEQGKQIAEIVFVPTGENLAIIEHTDVDEGNDSNLLIVFYVQIMPDDFVMQLHRF